MQGSGEQDHYIGQPARAVLESTERRKMCDNVYNMGPLWITVDRRRGSSSKAWHPRFIGHIAESYELQQPSKLPR